MLQFQMSKSDLANMKQLNNKLCMEHGLQIYEIGKKKTDGKDIISYDMAKYQFLKKAKEKNVKSYVQDTAIAVHNAMLQSKSKKEFIAAMEKQGYSVTWIDSRKYIVFINQDGKKVRNSNLQKTYNMPAGKDELIDYFKKKSLQKEKPSRRIRR